MNKRGVWLLVWAGGWLVSSLVLLASGGTQAWSLLTGIVAFLGFFLTLGGWIRDARTNKGAQKAQARSEDFMS